MMTLRVERFGFGKDSTLSELTISNDTFSCYVIEDERRTRKVKGETCIPVGTYEVLLKTDSPKFETKYFSRFPDIHRGMLWLQDVENFSFVYIHMGNKETHTQGCLLPNLVPQILPDGEFLGGRSKPAYEAIYRRVIAAFDTGERVFVEIAERQPDG